MAGGCISLRQTVPSAGQVAQGIKSMRRDDTFTDVKILIKGSVIPCHRFWLAVHSPVLQAMMTTNMTEAANGEVRLDHIGRDIMDIILDYMYFRDASCHSDQLMDVLVACNFLEMTELEDLCLDKVGAVLEPDNVLSWWMAANAMGLRKTKSECEEMMMVQFNEVSNQPDFLVLTPTQLQYCLRAICESDGMVDGICVCSLDSDAVVDAILRWTEHDEADRMIHLESLMQLVKLNKCTVEGITSVITAHDVILGQQNTVYKLLNNQLHELAESAKKFTTNSTLLVIRRTSDEASNPNETESSFVWTLNQSNKIEEFDIVPLDRDVFWASVCKVPPGFLITGGSDSSRCMMYVAASRSWVRLRDLLSRRRAHASICMEDKYVYVLGGYGDTAHKCATSVDVISMQGGRWQKGPDLPIEVHHAQVADVDDTVYLLDRAGTKQLLRLDNQQKVWSKLTSPPDTERIAQGYGESMTSARGRLYVAGGRGRLCAWYNTATDSWSTVRRPIQLHVHGSLVYYQGKLVLLGGSFGFGIHKTIECVEEYDIDEDTWKVCRYAMPEKDMNVHTGIVLDMPPLESDMVDAGSRSQSQ